MDRKELAGLMIQTLDQHKDRLIAEFKQADRIRSFIVDDLLPKHLAEEIAQAFPKCEQMILRHTMRERKHVSSQMNRYAPIIEETVFAFQEPSLISKMTEITGMPDLIGDDLLYAAGISGMTKGCFLKPHLDNSHDLSGKKYRVLNLLYYISPGWRESYGGNLEIWDRGVQDKPRTIVSQFNRLAVMTTFRSSWHSVSEVCHNEMRRCISSYYFSPTPIESKDYYHVTSFKGRPGDGALGLILEADRLARNMIRKTIRLFTKGNRGTFHVYQKNKNSSKS